MLPRHVTSPVYGPQINSQLSGMGQGEIRNWDAQQNQHNRRQPTSGGNNYGPPTMDYSAGTPPGVSFSQYLQQGNPAALLAGPQGLAPASAVNTGPRPQYGGGSQGFTPMQNYGPRPIPGYNMRPGYGMPSDFQNWQQQQQQGGIGGAPGFVGNTLPQPKKLLRAGWANGMMPDAVAATEGFNQQMSQMKAMQGGGGLGAQPQYGGNPLNNQYEQYQKYVTQGKAQDAAYQRQLAADKKKRAELEKQMILQGPYRPDRRRIAAQNPFLPQMTPAVTY